MSNKHNKKKIDETMFSMFGVSKAEPVEEQLPEAEALKPAEKARPAAPQTSEVLKPTNTVTYFAVDSVMEGSVKTEGDVEVAGPFHGDVTAKGKVILRSKMEGNITAQSLQLMGCKLTGNIVASGMVTLDETAEVVGNITAGELVCSGKVKGDLDVKGNLALNDKASVEGNIATQTMTMSCGAVVAGGVKMGCTEK